MTVRCVDKSQGIGLYAGEYKIIKVEHKGTVYYSVHYMSINEPHKIQIIWHDCFYLADLKAWLDEHYGTTFVKPIAVANPTKPRSAYPQYTGTSRGKK